MKIGDLVRDKVHQDGDEVCLVVAEPLAEEPEESATVILTRVLFLHHPYSEPEYVDVEDLELISETR